MTAIALPIRLASSLRTSGGDRGVGPEALRLRSMLFRSEESSRSLSVEEVYRTTVERIEEAAEEASAPDWDGYGGLPVTSPTIAQAFAFVALLPSALPAPDVSAHPDGELAFEWDLGPRRLLTVSVNDAGRLSYAALMGHTRLYGSEHLLDALPEPITLALRKLFAAQA